MADSFNLVHTSHPPEVVFDFISDFCHASLWDPRTRRVIKVSGGPIGKGTRFLLQADLLGLTPEFPYEIEVYERPSRLVFVGRTRSFAYREQVSFTAQGSGTSIEWRAAMRLEGWLALANPVLSLIYPRIGDDATAGIVPALDRALQTAPPEGR